MMLPDAALYDAILEQLKDGGVGQALTAAMEAVEKAFHPASWAMQI
jgi:type I restriction enzyme M protein